MKNKRVLYLIKRTAFIGAVLSGYIMWLALSSYTIVTHSFNCPIYVYNPYNTFDHIPESISVTLRGPRRILKEYLHHRPVIHIDASVLEAEHDIIHYALTNENLFLPQELSMVHYASVPLHKKQTKESIA